MTDPALALASLVVEEEESDVAKLKQAWMNEQHAPELLPYQTQLVDDVKAQLDAASETIEKLETKVENMLRIKLLQLDVTRVQYYLSRYLQLRLGKIQKFQWYLQAEKSITKLLSPQELHFLEGYHAQTKAHFEGSFLKDLPEEMQSLGLGVVTEPNFSHHLFMRVREELGAYQLDPDSKEDTDNLHKGAIMLLPYKSMRGLLLENKIDLI